MNQVVNLPDKPDGTAVSLDFSSAKTAYERRLDTLLATMEQQDYRAYRRARQIAMALKHEKGVTQAEIAERVGWSQGNLALYLNGHKAIGRNVLPLMCIALECEPHDIRTELKDPREDGRKEKTRQAIKRHMLAMDRWLKSGDLPAGLRHDMEKEKGRLQDQYAELLPDAASLSH